MGTGPSRTDPIVDAALALLERRACEPLLRLCDVAAELQVSHWQISVRLRKFTGKSFPQHLHDARVRSACLLMLKAALNSAQPLPCKAISVDVGYRRPDDFARQFAARLKLSPKVWQQRLRRLASVDRKIDVSRLTDPSYIAGERPDDPSSQQDVEGWCEQGEARG